MFKSGATFYIHNYYIVPFVPMMSVLAAYTLEFVPKQWIKALLLFIIVAEGIGNQQDGFRIKQTDQYLMDLETIMDQLTAPSDLIAINTRSGNPVEMYLAHRKGWMLLNQNITEARLDEIKKKGCRFLLINRKEWDGFTLPNRKKVLDTSHYWGYDLTQ